MARPLEPSDLGNRKYWGAAASVGFLMGIVAMHFMKSDGWLIGGMVSGLPGWVSGSGNPRLRRTLTIQTES